MKSLSKCLAVGVGFATRQNLSICRDHYRLAPHIAASFGSKLSQFFLLSFLSTLFENHLDYDDYLCYGGGCIQEIQVRPFLQIFSHFASVLRPSKQEHLNRKGV